MSMRDMIPWIRRDGDPVPGTLRSNEPFAPLQREMNRMFDEFFRGFDRGLPSLGRADVLAGGWPSVEISDGEKEIRITAELPGMEEKDVEVLLDDGVLTLRGEKRSETEDKDKQFSERVYGRFERRIPLGYEVVEDRIEAKFGNGVLTITLPKAEGAQPRARRIAIKG